MTKEQCDLHVGWVKEAFAKVPMTTTVASSSSVASPAAPNSQSAAALKKKRNAQELADTTMSLFKKKRST